MKKVYDFLFCDGVLHPGVVWYSVRVGTSRADKSAYRYLCDIIRGKTQFLFTLHSQEMAQFRQRVASSLFAGRDLQGAPVVSLLRSCFVDVVPLARFLKKYPAQFLNSPLLSVGREAAFPMP